MLPLADVGVLQNVEPLRVRGHQPVLDAVVHHLHEVAGAGRSAVEVSLFGCARGLVASLGTRKVTAPGGERLKDGVEVPGYVLRAADHHAVAALEPPDAAAGAHV